ncbi:MAG: type II toxin-antitoxin system Phd/YefM family antitoxin [Pseudonocardiaceae bacterium]
MTSGGRTVVACRGATSGPTLRDHLGEIVSRAEHAQERTVVTRHGKPVAAVISIEGSAGA